MSRQQVTSRKRPSGAEIRIRKFPERATDFLGRGRTIEIGDVTVTWDTGIRAWELGIPGVGRIKSYLIGRVVDGNVLISENILHDQPAQGPLANRAQLILEGLRAAGEDLGEWELQGTKA